MTTLPERYADLASLPAEGDSAPMLRMLGRLDEVLGPRAAPPEVRSRLERLLRERLAAASPNPPVILSRRAALKAGAAGMALFLTLGHIGPEQVAALGRLAGEGPMTGPRLMGILQAERAQWSALLARVGAARMELPGVEGEWSLKQLVAHLTWYERVIVDGARQVLGGAGAYERPREGLYGLTMEERNARIAQESLSRPLDEVLVEAEQVFGQLTALIAVVPQDILNDPRRVGMPDDVVPWMLVANNSFAHYHEHEQAVRAWLAHMTSKEPEPPR